MVQDFAIPLASSGLLGPGCSKYLPISKVTDLRLELTIENAIQAAVQGTGTPSFTRNTYIDIDPAVASQLEQAVGGRYIISSESWRNYTSILPASRSGDSVLIPARYSSLRTLLHVWRDYVNNSDPTKYWLCSSQPVLLIYGCSVVSAVLHQGRIGSSDSRQVCV